MNEITLPDLPVPAIQGTGPNISYHTTDALLLYAMQSVEQDRAQRQAGQALGPLAKRAIGDAIRAAYDLGYNDRALSHRTYDGPNVAEDHSGALIHRLDQLAAPPAAQAPKGYKLVPLEPTPEMVELGFGRDGDGLYRLHPAQTYRAMLSAVPDSPR